MPVPKISTEEFEEFIELRKALFQRKGFEVVSYREWDLAAHGEDDSCVPEHWMQSASHPNVLWIWCDHHKVVCFAVQKEGG